MEFGKKKKMREKALAEKDAPNGDTTKEPTEPTEPKDGVAKTPKAVKKVAVKKNVAKKSPAKKATRKKPALPKKVAARGKIWVTSTYPKGAIGSGDSVETHDEIELEVRVFETEPAHVRAGYGLTLNLGNYESARCDAGVTLPCYVEEVDSAIEEAYRIAEEKVQAQVGGIRDGQKKRGSLR